MFRSLLVPVDLSPASARVVGRAALLPLAKNARITLLHVVPPGLSRRARHDAVGDATRALAELAVRAAEKLPPSIRIEPLVKVGVAATEIARRAERAKAELVVLGRGGRRPLRDLFLGSTAERVIRRGQLPVLVVRLPARATYHRPALALELDQAAKNAVELLLRLFPSPPPPVDVIHARDLPYQGLFYPSLSREDADADRGRQQGEALRELAKLLPNGPSWKVQIRFGSPRKEIEKAVEKGANDLVALGTHGYTGLAHALLGTVAGDVLRAVTCDVLVVPPA